MTDYAFSTSQSIFDGSWSAMTTGASPPVTEFGFTENDAIAVLVSRLQVPPPPVLPQTDFSVTVTYNPSNPAGLAGSPYRVSTISGKFTNYGPTLDAALQGLYSQLPAGSTVVIGS